MERLLGKPGGALGDLARGRAGRRRHLTAAQALRGGGLLSHVALQPGDLLVHLAGGPLLEARERAVGLRGGAARGLLPDLVGVVAQMRGGEAPGALDVAFHLAQRLLRVGLDVAFQGADGLHHLALRLSGDDAPVQAGNQG